MAKKKRKNKARKLKQRQLEALALVDQVLKFDLIDRSAYLNHYKPRPQQYLAEVERQQGEIQDGPLVGLFISAAFTSFTAGLTIGLVSLAVGLVQYLLTPQPEGPRREDPRFAPRYGTGSATAGIARYGQILPAIYCSRSQESTGGYTTSGYSTNARIETENGAQVAYYLFSLGHGELGNVDLSRTLINEQPLLPSDPNVMLGWRGGALIQPSISEFTDISQNLPVSIYKFVGLGDLVDSAPIASNTTITVGDAEDSRFSEGETYLVETTAGQSVVRVISKTYNPGPPITSTIQITPALPVASGNAKLRSYKIAQYRTTRQVNRLDLNLAASVWARNTRGEVNDYCQAYELWGRTVNTASPLTRLCFFYIRSTDTSRLYRSITLFDMPLNTYQIELRPIPVLVHGGLPIFLLNDSGADTIYQSAVDIGQGVLPKIKVQGDIATAPLVGTLNTLLGYNNSQLTQKSGQNGATLEISHVNERENAVNAGRTRDLSYPGQALAYARYRFTGSSSASPNFLWFVDEGIKVEGFEGAGLSDAGSATTVMNAIAHGVTMSAGLRIRNCATGQSAMVTVLTPNTINTATTLDWGHGDQWYCYKMRSSCWWPEIASWLVRDDRFGSSRSFNPDYDIDYINRYAATLWVKGANEHNQSFAWHGSIGERQSIAQMDADNALKTLLFIIDDRYGKGYWPMKTPPVCGIFNASNATDFRVEETMVEVDPPNLVSLVYKEPQEERLGPSIDNGLRYQTQSLTARRWGTEASNEIQLQLTECTSRTQAIKTAQIRLNYGAFFGRTVASLSAKTIQAMGANIGCLIRLQLAETELPQELTGIVLAVNGTKFKLDREFHLVRSISTTANATGITDDRIDFIQAGVAIGDIVKTETGTTHLITALATHSLTLGVPFAKNIYYDVADLTPTGLLMAIGGGAMSSPIAAPTAFTTTFETGNVWHELLPPLPVIIGTVVAIGRNQIKDRNFQILALDIDLNSGGTETTEAKIQIGATGWEVDKMFDFSNIEITTIDNIINPDPG
jgi:hypothetical protein